MKINKETIIFIVFSQNEEIYFWHKKDAEEKLKEYLLKDEDSVIKEMLIKDLIK